MNKKKDDRRTFLKTILAGSATVAGVVASDKKVNAAPQQAGTYPEEQLYKESEHFRKYYETIK